MALAVRTGVTGWYTYSLVSFSREGHQKVRLSNEMVQLTTGYIAGPGSKQMREQTVGWAAQFKGD